MNDPLLTPDEAAKYLSISRATLITWRSRRPGHGPKGLKIGGMLRYRVSDLDEWVSRFEEGHEPH